MKAYEYYIGYPANDVAATSTSAQYDQGFNKLASSSQSFHGQENQCTKLFDAMIIQL